jgi:hypothetical protein
MGTTADAFAAGSCNFVYVVAIEGFPALLTNAATTAAALTAWAGTDWTRALGGLYVDLAHEHRFDPWKPFQGGGPLTLRVVPDSTDELGIAIARTAAVPYTDITASIDRDDLTFHVKRADDFAAATSEAFIGNECFEYSAKTSTTFTVSKRGKYSPFASGGTDTRFAGEHRISTFNRYTPLVPVVSQYRRTFRGAKVGVWAHRVVGGVLDVKAQALLVYAGVIDETVDTAQGNTNIICHHMLDVVKDAVLGADQYRGKVAPGIYLPAGTVIGHGQDVTTGNPVLTTHDLVVVASGAVAPNQLNEGHFTALDIVNALNAWVDAERTAGRLYGFYTFSIVPGTDTGGATRNFFKLTERYNIASSSTGESWFQASVIVADFLSRASGTGLAYLIGGGIISFGAGDTSWTSVYPIRRNGFLSNVFPNQRYVVSETSGAFFNQNAYFPPEYATAQAAGAQGFFLINGKTLIAGTISGNELINVFRNATWFGNLPDFTDDGETMEIVQVYVISGSFLEVMSLFFFSTGTTAYNNATYDVAPSTLSMAIPGGVLPNFLATLAAMPGSDIGETVWITKPKKFVDLFTDDCVMRGAHLIFRNGGLEWSVWSTPIAGASTPSLTESNKAEPSGNVISQRSYTTDSALWAKPAVDIKFDWSPIDDTFASDLSLTDPVGIDAQGGTSEFQVIELRNIGAGQAAVDALAVLLTGSASGDLGFVTKWQPWCSRTLRVMTRSIASTKYENLRPGDVVLVSDNHVRDPSTGRRGIANLPGLLLRSGYNLGGVTQPPEAGAKPRVSPPTGEIDVMLPAQNRATLWSPSADVDETVTGGGFTAGYNSATKTLRCKAHTYSESSETADAQRFVANDFVDISEIDPDVPATGLAWIEQQVVGVSGNDIVLTAALAGFDITKKYRVNTSDYPTVQASQKTTAFFASSTTGVVETTPTVPAFEYGLTAVNTATFTAADHTQQCEYLLLGLGGVGVLAGQPDDVGTHKALVQSVNNLFNHRTAHQSPSLGKTILTGGATGRWTIRELKKRFFGIGRYGLGAATNRYAYAAPFLRLSKGASASVRVTFARARPLDGYIVAATGALAGYTWSYPVAQQTFTTTSASWTTATELPFDLSVLDSFGCCWVAIELDDSVECRGLATCIERERV